MLRQRHKPAHRFHYWLVCRNEGKVFLIYGATDEATARSKGLEMLGGIDFEVRRLKTRDLSTASSMVRGVRLESGEGIRQASSRQGHEKSITRLRNKLDRMRTHSL